MWCKATKHLGGVREVLDAWYRSKVSSTNWMKCQWPYGAHSRNFHQPLGACKSRSCHCVCVQQLGSVSCKRESDCARHGPSKKGDFGFHNFLQPGCVHVHVLKMTISETYLGVTWWVFFWKKTFCRSERISVIRFYYVYTLHTCWWGLLISG